MRDVLVIIQSLANALCKCQFVVDIRKWGVSIATQVVKNLPARDPDCTPGSGRSPGEGNGYQLQDSCLENSMDRGALVSYSLGITKCQTRLSD